jgi:hypothetical protein
MSGRPFTVAEDAQIRAMRTQGLGDWAIGTALGRNKSSVERRVRLLERQPRRICMRCRTSPVINDDATDYRFCDRCREVISEHYDAVPRFAPPSRRKASISPTDTGNAR